MTLIPGHMLCRACRSSHHLRLGSYYPLLNSPRYLLLHLVQLPTSFRQCLESIQQVYTKDDLLKHPLAGRFQACDSASSMLAVLQEQVQELNLSQRGYTKWLDPTVNVLHTFSETLGEGVSSVCFRT